MLPITFPAPQRRCPRSTPRPPPAGPCWLLQRSLGSQGPAGMARFGDPRGASPARRQPSRAGGQLSSQARVQNAAPVRARVGGIAPTLPAGGRRTVWGKVCWTGDPPQPSTDHGARPGLLAEAALGPGLTLWSFHMAPSALTSWLECLPSSRHW